jgi:inorganic pyrophosphatase
MPDDSNGDPLPTMGRRSLLQGVGIVGIGSVAAGRPAAAAGGDGAPFTQSTEAQPMTGPLNLVTDVEQDFENGSVPETFMGVQTIPMGSRVKYEYRQDIPGIVLDRMLHSEVRYPGGYGFIPQTNAGDGDPLDVLVLLEDPLFPGTVLEVQPVGVLRMLDDGEDDDKIVAKPVDEPRLDHVESRADIPEHERAEIEEFFKTYKNLEDDPDVETNGLGPAEEAYDIVAAGAERFDGGS